ncbi:MAG: hypothetical protein FWB82_04800 [Treponema sp.]|nr:hypothetical protein [Treponema sp.]
MKKTMILVCATLFFTFALSGCPSPTTVYVIQPPGSGDGGQHVPPSLPPGLPSLVFSQQPVYSVIWDSNGFPVWGGRYMGTRTISSDVGGSGTISGGFFNFNIGTPTGLQPIANMWFADGATLQPAGVQARELRLSVPHRDSMGSSSFSQEYESATISGNTVRWEFVSRDFIFVSADIVVSNPGWTESETWSNEAGVTIGNITYTLQPFTLNLRAGWNAVYTWGIYSATFTGTWQNPTSVSGNAPHTVSTAAPADRPLRWAVSQW